MKCIDLFAGIGGFSLAARWMGWKTVAWCEWNEFGQKVLRYHFPEAEGFGDITKTNFTKYANTIDILTGGFPCQPYSQAGKRLGKEDDRHLWPEMLRAVREIQPSYVVGENVRGLTNWNGGMVFDEVQADLEAEGYEVLPFLLPACAVNAPHRRDRIWFVAHACREHSALSIQQRRQDKAGDINLNRKDESGDVTDTVRQGLQRLQFDRTLNQREQQRQPCKPITQFYQDTNWEQFPITEPTIRRRNDGISTRLAGITVPKHRNESIKAYGNAIVPKVAFQIFKAIASMEANISLK